MSKLKNDIFYIGDKKIDQKNIDRLWKLKDVSKRRALASMILGLLYLLITYYWIDPIEAHLGYQKVIAVIFIGYAAIKAQHYAQYDQWLKKEIGNTGEYDYKKREWKY